MEKVNYRIIKRDLHLRKRKFMRRLYISLSAIIISTVLGLCMFTSFASGDLSEARYKYYTSINIESDDNLWDISSRYISDEYKSKEEFIAEIKQLNHLSDNNIKAGEHLVIPYYSSEASL